MDEEGVSGRIGGGVSISKSDLGEDKKKFWVEFPKLAGGNII